MAASMDCGHALIGAAQVPLRGHSVLYVGLSLADLILTHTLLFRTSAPDLEFVEWNPVANAILQGGGFAGMLLFKLTLILFVLGICQWIARSRLDVAKRVIRFGLAAVSTIVIYSATLLMKFSG